MATTETWDGEERRSAPRTGNIEDVTVGMLRRAESRMRRDAETRGVTPEAVLNNPETKFTEDDEMRKELRFRMNVAVDQANPEASELSPEQMWLNQFKIRFDAIPQLHAGIQWTDIEKSLKADPKAMRKLQALDSKGHAMNVFGEEGDEFIFASAWNDYAEVSEDHRNVVFDKKAQDWLAEHHPRESCNGNAVDIAKALGVDLADPKSHEQLRKAIAVNGWAWLKTDAATRKTGGAFAGDDLGCYRRSARDHRGYGSFRAALRVKKA